MTTLRDAPGGRACSCGSPSSASCWSSSSGWRWPQLLASMISARALESAKDSAVLTTTIAIQPLLTADDLVARAAGREGRGAGPCGARVSGRAPRSPGSRSGTTTATCSTSPTRTPRSPANTEHAQPPTSWPRRSRARSRPRSSAAATSRTTRRCSSATAPCSRSTCRSCTAATREPAGVFELYLPYEPVQASIRADTTRAVALLFGGLVVLWLGLFRTVATASRRLRRRGRPQRAPGPARRR